MNSKDEAATQTSGIYYPNAKDLDLIMKQNRQILAQQEFPEYKSRISAASPGKGYWKQQIDHVYNHLQDYAANRPKFQSLIGKQMRSETENFPIAVVLSLSLSLSFEIICRDNSRGKHTIERIR
jgi:hypothetical protein